MPCLRGRLKGIAVVPKNIERADLERLKAAGMVRVAFNAAHHGAECYADTAPLLAIMT